MAYWDYNEILTRMLIAAQAAEPECDTREGSLIYTACAPMAAELAQNYIAATLLLENTFADSATREYLIRRAAERGLTPYAATKARYTASWDYHSGGVQPNERYYSADGVEFVVLSVNSGAKTCLLECSAFGTVGNGKTGSLTPVISNVLFKSMVFTDTILVAEDEESTERLRARYFRELQSLDFGGSVADYVNFVNQLAGVGAVKVQPVWNGGGTVKVIITDSSLQPATPALVATVQNELDPAPGQGLGIAPIGHTVTVQSADATIVTVSAYFIYLPGYSFELLGSLMTSKVKAYFDDLNSTWETTNVITVRESNIISALLEVPGVLDIQTLTLNGQQGNLILPTNHIVKYGVLTDTGA